MEPFSDYLPAADGPERFHSGGSVAPAELGDILARLVWESFSDFLVEPATQTVLSELGIPSANGGVPHDHAAEELLILHLWAHTRAVQLSFFRRAPEDLVRSTLDALHQAVFEDMATHGTPRHQLPLFEQRVGARYAEYYEAAEISDEHVGHAAAGHLATEPDRELSTGALALAGRAVEVANPLRDYLDDLELAEP